MRRQCLICESAAILTKEAAIGIALLTGTADGFLQGVYRTRSASDGTSRAHPLGYLFSLLLGGLEATISGNRDGMLAGEDVARYHFGGFSCLCLRCGARFDDHSDGALAQPEG